MTAIAKVVGGSESKGRIRHAIQIENERRRPIGDMAPGRCRRKNTTQPPENDEGECEGLDQPPTTSLNHGGPGLRKVANR